VGNVARNRELFVGHLEPSVEGLHNLLVELETHGWLQIRQNVHLCKEGQCHESAMHLAKDTVEALLDKAVHQNNEHAVGHVDVIADFLQQRHGKGDNALDTKMLHLVHIDILCHDATKQRGDERTFVLDTRWLYAHNEQCDLLLRGGLGRPGDGMYGHIGRDAVICRRQRPFFVVQALQHFAQRHPALSRPNIACHERSECHLCQGVILHVGTQRGVLRNDNALHDKTEIVHDVLRGQIRADVPHNVENQVSIARDLRRLEQERDGVCPIDFAVVNAEEKVDREIRNNVLWDVILLRTPCTQSVPLFARQAKTLFHWPRQTPAHGAQDTVHLASKRDLKTHYPHYTLVFAPESFKCAHILV